MSPRLLDPVDAAAVIAKRLTDSWAERVCAELLGEAQPPVECHIRPGVDRSAAVGRIGFAAWGAWRVAWRKVDLTGLPGVQYESRDIGVEGRTTQEPLTLCVHDLEAGLRLLGHLGGPGLDVDIDRARRIGARLRDAGAVLTPGALRALCRLSDADVAVAAEAVAWLCGHPDLSGWTTRQLPVPGAHTKWLIAHGGLVRSLLGRDVAAETRARPSVVHLTYTDPRYLATGRRRHDAWTTGDSHELAYRPRIVLVVENRDCRLGFPVTVDTVVVEGSGKAAAASLSRIEWLVGAEHLIYWGDIDADGFAILDGFRAALMSRGVGVNSILMDVATLVRYAHLGVDRDKHGDLLRPSTLRLPHLTDEEAACYARVATAGKTPFRRIEQERIPTDDAARALIDVAKG
ncbi:hypothetical protein GCM10009785_30830 [Brooklawnia cerclae]|uniref:Wadjet protein JetD C-terminal domain-containing protein n=1 Tax=Brooklawnia cerclae TaxID=349934 RepID=A0ABX0SF74_9ACTN|nr:DUF3322 and DUF2220 domain-containing protein [Brooklawnia cerclae]NIH56626.1 hypothetical protein [Brooklawnia cerclae]